MAPGGPELLIIVGLAILLFGAQKIPKLARSIGKSAGEFKKGQAKVEQELEEIKPDMDLDAEPTPDVEPETTQTQS